MVPSQWRPRRPLAPYLRGLASEPEWGVDLAGPGLPVHQPEASLRSGPSQVYYWR